MGSELAMKLASFEVVAALRSGDYLHSQFSYSPLENDFCCVGQSLGGGEAAKEAFDGLVIEEVVGTFPL
ncbi:MAG: hypothetical protein WBL39_22855 [Terrimicrobiaceae bacterium]